MTLSELAKEEGRLLTEVRDITGSMEEKHAQMEQLGVFDAYARVHAAYADLAADGDTEALKRALFLQWYAVSEPACFTGLFEMEPEAERRVLERLDHLAGADSLDAELQWMLPYYHAISDFHFDTSEGLPSLKRWLHEHARDHFPEERVRDATLDERGQMGMYWYRPDDAPLRAV